MRLLAMGNSALMDGFALLGMETFPDVTVAEVEKLLSQLLHDKERAMIYLQQDLAQQDLPILNRIRNEGGDILISEIPDLLSAQSYQAPVDQLLTRVLGASAAQEFNHEE